LSGGTAKEEATLETPHNTDKTQDKREKTGPKDERGEHGEAFGIIATESSAWL
jgi:hypothetical protein